MFGTSQKDTKLALCVCVCLLFSCRYYQNMKNLLLFCFCTYIACVSGTNFDEIEMWAHQGKKTLEKEEPVQRRRLADIGAKCQMPGCSASNVRVDTLHMITQCHISAHMYDQIFTHVHRIPILNVGTRTMHALAGKRVFLTVGEVLDYQKQNVRTHLLTHVLP